MDKSEEQMSPIADDQASNVEAMASSPSNAVSSEARHDIDTDAKPNEAATITNDDRASTTSNNGAPNKSEDVLSSQGEASRRDNRFKRPTPIFTKIDKSQKSLSQSSNSQQRDVEGPENRRLLSPFAKSPSHARSQPWSPGHKRGKSSEAPTQGWDFAPRSPGATKVGMDARSPSWYKHSRNPSGLSNVMSGSETAIPTSTPDQEVPEAQQTAYNESLKIQEGQQNQDAEDRKTRVEEEHEIIVPKVEDTEPELLYPNSVEERLARLLVESHLLRAEAAKVCERFVDMKEFSGQALAEAKKLDCLPLRGWCYFMLGLASYGSLNDLNESDKSKELNDAECIFELARDAEDVSIGSGAVDKAFERINRSDARETYVDDIKDLSLYMRKDREDVLRERKERAESREREEKQYAKSRKQLALKLEKIRAEEELKKVQGKRSMETSGLTDPESPEQNASSTNGSQYENDQQSQEGSQSDGNSSRDEYFDAEEHAEKDECYQSEEDSGSIIDADGETLASQLAGSGYGSDEEVDQDADSEYNLQRNLADEESKPLDSAFEHLLVGLELQDQERTLEHPQPIKPFATGDIEKASHSHLTPDNGIVAEDLASVGEEYVPEAIEDWNDIELDGQPRDLKQTNDNDNDQNVKSSNDDQYSQTEPTPGINEQDSDNPQSSVVERPSSTTANRDNMQQGDEIEGDLSGQAQENDLPEYHQSRRSAKDNSSLMPSDASPMDRKCISEDEDIDHNASDADVQQAEQHEEAKDDPY